MSNTLPATLSSSTEESAAGVISSHVGPLGGPRRSLMQTAINVREHLILTILGGVVGIAILAGILFFEKRTYQATAVLKLDVPNNEWTPQTEVASEKLRSMRLAERVANLLSQDLSFASLEDYLANISIEVASGTPFIRVKAASDRPKLAALVANKHAEEFVRLSREEQVQGLDSEKLHIERQLKSVEGEISAISKELEQSSAGAVIGAEQVGESLQILRKLSAEASSNRIRAETALKNFESDPSKTPESPSGISLARNMTELTSQKQFLAKTLGPKHPEMVRITTQIQTSQNGLAAEREKYLAALKSDLEAIVANEASLKAQLIEQGKALAVNEATAQYQVKKQEYETLTALHKDLTEELRPLEAALNKRSPISISELASVPGRAMEERPLPWWTIMLGICGGYLLSVFRKFGSRSFANGEEIETRLRLHAMAAVPAIEFVYEEKEAIIQPDRIISLQLSAPELITVHLPESVASEAYRSLRAALMLSSDKTRVIQLTSALEGEGKTITACNLAVVFAAANKRIILIDADLRDPQVGTLLRCRKGEAGLREYLGGTASLDDVILETDRNGLSILLAGERSNDPSALLSSERLKDLLGELKKRFDYVILDSAAVLPASDALILSQSVDGVSLIVGTKQTKAPMVERALVQLRRAGANVVGAALNEKPKETKRLGKPRSNLKVIEGKKQEALPAPVLSADPPVPVLSDFLGEFKELCKGEGSLKVVERDEAEDLRSTFLQQQKIVEAKINHQTSSDILLFSSSTPILSMGRGGDLNAISSDISVIEVNRGGKLQFHAPGQLLVFPVLDLKRHSLDAAGYLRKLQAVITDALIELKCPEALFSKVASLGIGVRSDVTFHGFALNVDVDRLIVPSLVIDNFSSLSEVISAPPSMTDVKRVVLGALLKHFSFESLSIFVSMDGAQKAEETFFFDSVKVVAINNSDASRVRCNV